MKTNNLIYIILILVSIIFINSCSQDGRNNTNQSLVMDFDSISVKLKYSETLFIIPSPDQTTGLLKRCRIEFKKNILASNINPDAYTSTVKKAIILGIIGADLSYLNLYSQKELASEYLLKMQKLLIDLEIDNYIDIKVVDKISNHIGVHDSVLYYISALFKQCDRFLKLNNKNDIGALIITGGWIESIYFLTELYNDTKSAQLQELILYQKEIVNNLVKIISPFYEKSDEFKTLIDDIINIKYEFDIVDKASRSTIHQDSSVSNNNIYTFPGSKLDGIIKSIQKLRKKLLL